jgi:hypothetical protein
VTNIAYPPIDEGLVYLRLVYDAWSRKSGVHLHVSLQTEQASRVYKLSPKDQQGGAGVWSITPPTAPICTAIPLTKSFIDPITFCERYGGDRHVVAERVSCISKKGLLRCRPADLAQARRPVEQSEQIYTRDGHASP